MPFIPYEVDVPYDRKPVMNWLVVSVIFIIFLLQFQHTIEERQRIRENLAMGQDVKEVRRDNPFEPFVLYDWTIKGLLGHMWLHGGWLHVIGNLIFLWLFGNAICSKIGNTMYLPVYILLGVTSAAFHQTFSGVPAIGASGAINGIVGMYLVFFPENTVSCFFWLFIPIFLKPLTRTFSVSGVWVILVWFIYDIWGLMRGEGYVAYWAHVGGFLAGFVLAILMLKLKCVDMEMYEKSLLQLIGLDKVHHAPGLEDSYRKDLGFWQSGFVDSQTPQTEIPPVADEQPIPLPDEGHDQASSVEPYRLQQSSQAGVADSAGPAALAYNKPAGKTEDKFVIMRCSCGERFRVPLALSGKSGICPKCKARVKIPDKQFISLRCPCGKNLKIPAALAGRSGRCPKCKRRLKIPSSRQ